LAAILSISLLLATSTYAQLAFPTNVPRQASALPLTEYHYPYSNVPYQVNPYPSGRGPQSGYNVCNSTTEGPNSQCQTAFVNSIDDFCLWGSPIPNGEIGNIEASVVAYCTKPGHGTRVMPAGTLKSVQFMRTSAYVQVSGKFDQRGIGLTAADTGGELDPHGADLAGNPLGGLVFSNSLPGSRGVITQGENWSCFVGSGFFCMKVCDNSIRDPDYCQNIYDLIGCAYNMPSDSYTRSDFTDCQGDLQLPPGVYVENGHTLTWSQPESLSPTNTMPWQPVVPASSSCTTFTSAQVYAQQTGSVDGSTTASGSAATRAATSSQHGSGAPTSTSSSGAMSNGIPATGLASLLVALVALL